MPLELPQTLTEHTFSCNASQILAEAAQPPELSALEKRVLLPVSIVAAGGAEQHREADRDHKPTGICTKPSSVGFGKSAFSLDDSRTWRVRVAVAWWLPEAVTGCVTCASDHEASVQCSVGGQPPKSKAVNAENPSLGSPGEEFKE